MTPVIVTLGYVCVEVIDRWGMDLSTTTIWSAPVTRGKQQRKSTLEVISNDVMLDLYFSLTYLFFD
jgi:hypothetical protein